MMDNFGFKINKYFKVSLAIGLIDLLIFIWWEKFLNI